MNLELRKQKEIEYYNKHAQLEGSSQVDFKKIRSFSLNSFTFLESFLKEKCRNKRVLDYGCGNGILSIWLKKHGANIVGIDLSEKYLEIAKKRAGDIEFLLMDCEDLKFPDNSFDIIFDRGTFSSLDLDKALPELVRVLKPDGFLIGIETLGHNPFTNFKRKLNKVSEVRTEWAASHILKMKDFEKIKRYFQKTDKHFFHIVSWIVFPFLSWPGAKILLKLLEKADKLLLCIPFLKKYAFKVVFVLSHEKII